MKKQYIVLLFGFMSCFLASCLAVPPRGVANESELREAFAANRQDFDSITRELKEHGVSRVHLFDGHLQILPEKARLGKAQRAVRRLMTEVGLESIYLDDQGVAMIAKASQVREGFYVTWGFSRPQAENGLSELILVKDVAGAPCDEQHETVYEMLPGGWYLYRRLGPLAPTLFPK